MKNIAIIFAGGSGKRMNLGDVPKQFLKVKNKEVIVHTIDIFEKSEMIDGIIVVCIESWISYMWEIIALHSLNKVVEVVPGGHNGQNSIYNGLVEAVNRYGTESVNVLIHDGVRPLINDQLIQKNIESVVKNGNAITVSPAIETIVEVDAHQLIKFHDRSSCMLAKAPQSFRLVDIHNCHLKSIEEGKLDFVDSATMMAYYGVKLNIVEGRAENIKITTQNDFFMFKALMEQWGDQ